MPFFMVSSEVISSHQCQISETTGAEYVFSKRSGSDKILFEAFLYDPQNWQKKLLSFEAELDYYEIKKFIEQCINTHQD